MMPAASTMRRTAGQYLPSRSWLRYCPGSKKRQSPMSDVACDLGHPSLVWMQRHARHMDFAADEMENNQHLVRH